VRSTVRSGEIKELRSNRVGSAGISKALIEVLWAHGQLVGDLCWVEDGILMGVKADTKECVDNILQKVQEVISWSHSAVDLDFRLERAAVAEKVVVL